MKIKRRASTAKLATAGKEVIIVLIIFYSVVHDLTSLNQTERGLVLRCETHVADMSTEVRGTKKIPLVIKSLKSS